MRHVIGWCGANVGVYTKPADGLKVTRPFPVPPLGATPPPPKNSWPDSVQRLGVRSLEGSVARRAVIAILSADRRYHDSVPRSPGRERPRSAPLEFRR